LKIYKKALEVFFKGRPREWLSFLTFRATNMEVLLSCNCQLAPSVPTPKCFIFHREVDQGYICFIVVAQHRSSWAEWGTRKSFLLRATMNQSYSPLDSPQLIVVLSKADLIHFCMELSKKLDIWYKTPPLPVDLSVSSLQSSARTSAEPPALSSEALNEGVFLDLIGLLASFPPRED